MRVRMETHVSWYEYSLHYSLTKAQMNTPEIYLRNMTRLKQENATCPTLFHQRTHPWKHPNNTLGYDERREILSHIIFQSVLIIFHWLLSYMDTSPLQNCDHTQIRNDRMWKANSWLWFCWRWEIISTCANIPQRTSYDCSNPYFKTLLPR